MSAFWEDPTWILLWPKEVTLEFLIEQCTKRYPNILQRARQEVRHQKATDLLTGDLVGYARWILPPTHFTAKGGSSQWWVLKFRITDMRSIDDINDAVMDRILVQRPYIKLDYLAVHPRNKGKGIATALVASGIRAAKSINVPIVTMSYKAGRGVYTRLGFEEVDRVIQDDSQYGGAGEYGAYFMIYDTNN
ncbi:hypothetical protein ABOM_006474 [Aspergillus bombycis]|uniref:N-acetyltransferase domain-containing protein n=1 Tax=Aspergillus bombycis TaxID=109264 RepID=A0A1F8A2D9_9EURO|nr:hypothetical protein ABOM_006474 [Aspergillus bombycis]OGM45515.1 hypothetical protein ABOM_006474 [Aspergillus bombycis]